MAFVNRTDELSLLKKHGQHCDFVVIFGRRRVGKTALVREWAKTGKIVYSQAIEAATNMQITQINQDLSRVLPSGIAQPQTWDELLGAIALVREKVTVVIDEFPYLVNSDSTLPSRLQRWLDHSKPKNVGLVLLGSSQHMMHGMFLDGTAPLYGRADRILHLKPMSYKHFCQALKLKPSERESYVKFAMVGGVPRYWNFLRDCPNPLEAAEKLYFGDQALLSEEPDRLLRDEAIEGINARSLLEAIGRGAQRPSEIASRMGLPQTSLSKTLQLLMQTSLIRRRLPFGESVRSSKRTLYQIQDPCMRFWYEVFSPHQSRWNHYSAEKRLRLLNDHASKLLEDSFQQLFSDCSSYWEGSLVEFDCVRFADETMKSVVISELKWSSLDPLEKKRLKVEIDQKFLSSEISRKYKLAAIEVLDFGDVSKKLAE